MLEARAYRTGIGGGEGSYWAVVTDGPQPLYINDDGDPVNFFHFVAVYRFNPDASWSEVDRIEIDSAPQRSDEVEIVPIPDALVWIVTRGTTGAHAGTLDVIRWHSDGTLATVLSHISSRPSAGEVTDLDGDGVPEFVLNTSNPYVFCYACAVEEHSVAIHRWDGDGADRGAPGGPAGRDGRRRDRRGARRRAGRGGPVAAGRRTGGGDLAAVAARRRPALAVDPCEPDRGGAARARRYARPAPAHERAGRRVRAPRST